MYLLTWNDHWFNHRRHRLHFSPSSPSALLCFIVPQSSSSLKYAVIVPQIRRRRPSTLPSLSFFSFAAISFSFVESQLRRSPSALPSTISQLCCRWSPSAPPYDLPQLRCRLSLSVPLYLIIIVVKVYHIHCPLRLIILFWIAFQIILEGFQIDWLCCLRISITINQLEWIVIFVSIYSDYVTRKTIRNSLSL